MRITICWLAMVFAMLSGCVAPYTLVSPGHIAVQSVNLQTDDSWNRAPRQETPAAIPGTETWTKDGLLLDRLVIVPGVADGEALLKSRSDSAALPLFRADMLPNEIEELIESSMVKLLGEGQSAIDTENLRPHRFGENLGVMFDLVATVTDSPQYRGTAGAFIADDTLYVMYFLAAVPYYYNKHQAAAVAVIESATL